MTTRLSPQEHTASRRELEVPSDFCDHECERTLASVRSLAKDIEIAYYVERRCPSHVRCMRLGSYARAFAREPFNFFDMEAFVYWAKDPLNATCTETVLGVSADSLEHAVLGTFPCQNKCDASSERCVSVGQCACKEGFARDTDQSICADVNECERLPPVCPIENSECVNTRGSYHCECKIGYEPQDDDCVDSCELHTCNSDRREHCSIVSGSPACVCVEGDGRKEDGGVCLSSDSCVFKGCNSSGHEFCDDAIEIPECKCEKGYERLDEGCVNSESCLISKCTHDNEVCNTEKGVCECGIGYEYRDGQSGCHDIKACNRENACPSFRYCRDLKGARLKDGRGYECLPDWFEIFAYIVLPILFFLCSFCVWYNRRKKAKKVCEEVCLSSKRNPELFDWTDTDPLATRSKLKGQYNKEMQDGAGCFLVLFLRWISKSSLKKTLGDATGPGAERPRLKDRATLEKLTGRLTDAVENRRPLSNAQEVESELKRLHKDALGALMFLDGERALLERRRESAKGGETEDRACTRELAEVEYSSQFASLAALRVHHLSHLFHSVQERDQASSLPDVLASPPDVQLLYHHPDEERRRSLSDALSRQEQEIAKVTELIPPQIDTPSTSASVAGVGLGNSGTVTPEGNHTGTQSTTAAPSVVGSGAGGGSSGRATPRGNQSGIRSTAAVNGAQSAPHLNTATPQTIGRTQSSTL
uniref:EGF-like domain-containing protein n=1 Tax=Chromera velia CCMP2878 TaxID=1169474 RepID=A0A0G4HZ37_9ALVE|eukprot:Cvel_9636.t1-p1 / transcript=Cvel_9636.t1 / gene=Cvel_9636 / organism=Chromera_velia_CCMP2878 / gene_product=Fibrillin-2, putative / transcript_product=Fibrillin-2, putative / location=Cvel_scaffold560:34706-37089(-) / protein_length=703 / sequence_SO=supercontig / SO=protein_coding / is_pseudo=false